MLNKAALDICQIVNPARFQKVQDDFSVATGLAVLTVDYRGVPITRHSICCDFCKIMRTSDVYRNQCEKCDSRGGLEAARLHKPFIYVCHAGLIDLAVPIIVDNLYLGAFLAGQILLDNEEDAHKLEHISSGAGEVIDFNKDKILRAHYNRLPVMSLDRIEALSKLLQHIGNYCIEEAILRASVEQLNVHRNQTEAYKSAEHYFENNQNQIHPVFHAKAPSRVLQPAFEYIRQHPHERIKLSSMAALCNVSSSYFSKLFAKENIGSLSNYVNKVKVTKAMELLQNTDWSVRCVAEKLGFDDCSYFIKVFKNEIGLTPEEFRSKGNI